MEKKKSTLKTRTGRIVSFLLVMAMMLGVVGCGSSSSTSSSSESATESSSSSTSSEDSSSSTATSTDSSSTSKEITVAVTGDPVSLAPATSANADSRATIIVHIYQQLFYMNEPGGEFQPLVGESYENDLENNTTTVKVRTGIYDCDGNKIDAYDVAFSFNHAKETLNSVQWNKMLSCEATDETTVIFTWEEGCLEQVGFLMQLFCYGCPIVSEEAFNASEDGMVTTPVGSGPYKVTSYSSGSSIVLEKNENYWMLDSDYEIPSYYQQNADKITIEVITESAQLSIALESGAVDFTTVSAEDVQIFEGDDNYNLYEYEDFLGCFMCFNMSSEYCSNENLRKAIAYAVDSAGALQVAVGNGVVIHALAGSPASCADYNVEWDSLDYYNYDLDTAMEYLNAYLEETGQSASDITIKMISPNTSPAQDAIEIVQSYILALGIGCEIEVYDNATYTTMVNATDEYFDAYDIVLFGSGTNGNVGTFQLGDDNNALFKFDKTTAEYAELLTYTEPCEALSTYTAEAIDALWEYAYENCFGKGLFKGYSTAVSNTKVTDIQMDCKNHFIWGSFTFAD
ncbi:MAG: ABC transporter substrate-binding protein [Lachnospiraceae bacterium]|nr:ABC transporter substrate-binding protein [Lachnospiraceae bacterium]